MADKKPYGEECFPEELRGGYELADWVGSHRQHFGRFGIIDLNDLTKQKVDRLISKGFQRIRKKEPAKVSTTTDTKSATPTKK
ncbi:hypothetical protein [Flavilitoribacter nigricans]|uniref:Uncharacterized protein n=1 Tax=Flavilitoribacter nigricans (strain ATCC 23147 / DSM 23189 / NBRC 102662 / NCIMB 1420 / SS-2) TaxID=1122177 RepID=A0A2D0NEM9_FLAN2|nr:hypothetical protein [Flavilitoribacter nigricans]PHN06952.1 hypothetical protein CRP01_09050 [Flavilitoribacter nigricans DSM 23189 = NBRC 102662]